MKHETYMKEALTLAEKGRGRTSPNPLVGSVLVKNGRVIGQGYHEKFGGLHAERNAFLNCTESPENATMYVTLEPCDHQGKTPPCTDAIIENRIQRVVIGVRDPNLLVAGSGVRKLKENGIEVIENILEDECADINRVFFHFIKTGLPYVTMKYAMTLDGKIATREGHSRWITNEKSRAHVHQTRSDHTAIMVGIGTVLADDPLLTSRVEGGRNPLRLICDTTLRTPLTSHIVTTATDVPTMIVTCSTGKNKLESYTSHNCQVMTVGKKNGRIDLRETMEKLGTMQIDSILLEGGGELNWTMLSQGLVNRVQAYIAPKIFGGSTALTPISGKGVAYPKEAFGLSVDKITTIGDDILIESEVRT